MKLLQMVLFSQKYVILFMHAIMLLHKQTHDKKALQTYYTST